MIFPGSIQMQFYSTLLPQEVYGAKNMSFAAFKLFENPCSLDFHQCVNYAVIFIAGLFFGLTFRMQSVEVCLMQFGLTTTYLAYILGHLIIRIDHKNVSNSSINL